MSRIGRKPIPVPAGVKVEAEDHRVKVVGPKGELVRQIHPRMQVVVAEGEVRVERPSDQRLDRSLHGLTRTLIANMVQGVTQGFQKDLLLSGVGYRAAKQGSKLVLSLGFSHPVEVDPPQGIEIDVPQPTRISVRGIDKELVGQTAAEIRILRKAEPYLGKGIRYENERVRRKAGKAGKVSKG
ncbi:50S ribosomal protein L6 [Limnochorda pilosa]|uniref:Large ribosomal subunit protein uL6 n=1 Tax=Limnochorda pilosa TaxID=1555112 RepID=A0A0K2SPL0_LIMPI|nr:50S ribosomal protein L6 [Limnochorda pilosa]BAS29073.1 50S ribosomal protein L6 [Limnochorda pilosa]